MILVNHLFHDTVFAWATWFAVAVILGALTLARDELRLRRRARTPAEVCAYADRLVALYGENALAGWMDALRASDGAKDVERRRFFDQVCEELIRRLVNQERGGEFVATHGATHLDSQRDAPIGVQPPY